MRKILLATTALVAFAGAAQAAESPIQVTLGGSVDFRAALFHEAAEIAPTAAVNNRRSGDFQTEYDLTIAAQGKAAGGVEYGALINIDNDQARATTEQVALDQAYVWMSGAFGKVLMGDEHGATDLFVYAPTVGEGQIDGSYTNFTDSDTLARFQPTYLDVTENNTKVTYYTPKVGNANHKIQLGASFAPNSDRGNSVIRRDVAGYRNNYEIVAQYTGTFSPVSVVLSPMVAMGDGRGESATTQTRDYTAWGVGAQAMYAGFTAGGSYVDAGRMGTRAIENRDQNVWNLGLKYEFDKVALATNYMNGEGYYTLLTTNVTPSSTGTPASVYVDDFSALGFGATYTWFPGLRTAADAVFFDQNRAATARNNTGHVLMLSQKMTF